MLVVIARSFALDWDIPKRAWREWGIARDTVSVDRRRFLRHKRRAIRRGKTIDFARSYVVTKQEIEENRYALPLSDFLSLRFKL